ncbi:NADH dehydrogenase subunit N [Desulforamulus reducens MI-1]|uniref:NADH-quinone oxidoreductase subunit N n=1 Tax=Desulforamulus reducens (strain ATCC BAA-1160 / DSM 100696 / MI-1) TaxID=349161 RepID=NUON_DESRM|nr:NADH-quinone oxidoreductase subunit N [Desulforamulus reducens]A4J650.1 RecName: Full=NADH-quinone oxidoreductase subunit N; AltName: Full=NADH dehydrogenase I subunit N; AltName: Full=NDH-1 subunit N [Desulforamulus reducens MI-1]ABO50553.1 NADH dehydrogenase subunit N [Desulforamulus reducens MI-1]
MEFNFALITTELALFILGLATFVLGLLVPSHSRRGLGSFALLGLLLVLGITIINWSNQGVLLDGMYLVDQYATFFKILCLISAILVVLGSFRYIDKQVGNQFEYYSTVIFTTLGMVVMASAGDFITLYLGLELMTISFVILVAFRSFEAKSLEAGMKYILLAGLSSAVLLYGLSLVYGATGTILIGEVAREIADKGSTPLLIVGVVMLVAGLGFKISAVPFHMWSPDVYEGAPTPVTSFLAVGSKAASFAVLLRLFAGGFGGIQEQWTLLVAVLAALSMLIGNLVAIPQTNIKRMLAYSSIAQAGYIMVGLVSATEAGIKGVMFYAFLYVFATIGAFTVVAIVSNQTNSDEIRDYAGLIQRAPLAASVMLICLLSMAGIPPLAGFVGKFYLFKTVVENHMWLVYLGLIMSMVSVYYYLRVALVMFRDEPKESAPIHVGGAATITLVITMVATIILGIYPGPLAEVANMAAQSFLLK